MAGRDAVDIRELTDGRGRSYFAGWFDDLNASAAAKVTTALERMAEGNLGDVKSVGGGVLERRIAFGPGYRIYFGRDGDTLIILLGGGTKRRQSTDIARARALWEEYRTLITKGSESSGIDA